MTFLGKIKSFLAGEHASDLTITKELPVVYTTKVIPGHRECLHVEVAKEGKRANRVIKPEEVASLCEFDDGTVVLRFHSEQENTFVFTDEDIDAIREMGGLESTPCDGNSCRTYEPGKE